MKLNKTRRRKLIDVFILIARIGLGCLFIYSSLQKIRQPYDFLSSVYGYELVGPKLGMFVAMTLPWLELFTGVCLVGGIFISGALLTSIAMGAMFSYVIISSIHRGLDISCGCFSSSGTGKIDYLTLIRALTILVFGILAYLCLVFHRGGKECSGRRTCADQPGVSGQNGIAGGNLGFPV